MQINLLDVADDLLVVNRATVERLFEAERAVDCLALYMFYYKTAKWQGTNRPKAADIYVRKCLGWGQTRLAAAKQELKELGLVDVIRGTKAGKVAGWYVEVKYIVSSKKLAENEAKLTPGPEVPSASNWCADNKCLKTKDKCLKTKYDLDTNVSKGESPQSGVVEAPERSARSLDIDAAFGIWEEVMGYPLHQTRDDRFALNALLSRKGMNLDKLRLMVMLVKQSQSDRYKRFTIACYADLLHRTNDLMAWAHERQSQHGSGKVEAI